MLAIRDIDGTLVDTNYHHAIGLVPGVSPARSRCADLADPPPHRDGRRSAHRIADQQQTDERLSDAIRTAEGILYGEVQTMHGAQELITELKRRGHRIVFASSAKAAEVDHYLNLLAGRDLADGWTTSADVQATKPDPDLVHAALALGQTKPADAVMIGDTSWDAQAAHRAKVKMLAVLTGGFSASELEAADVLAVYESVADLRDRLDETPLA
jgi:HAD superfamily hydrolase (TIGR01509 family)